MKKLNLNAIRIDGGTQSRVAIDNDAVSDYAEAVKVGIEFPPVVVFHDGADYWLADGFHRFHAHGQAGKASIPADVRAGTVRDAILYSLGANCTHGLRRSNADKRKAVETMLRDTEWAAWSDSKIAKACGVSDKTVAAHRASIFGNSEDAKPAVRTVERAGKVYQQDTSKIGKPAAPMGAAPAAPAKRSSAQERPADIPELTDADRLAEARDTLAQVAQENEHLRDRLAVEAMDASEEEKLQAAETITELRERVRVLEIELDAVKGSRDTYMRENAELKKQVKYWRNQAEKAAKAAA